MQLFENFKSLESKLVLLTTILVSTIGFFSATSIAIAIPNIQSSLNATIDQIQWVLYSFMIVVSVGILMSGTLADYFGFKTVLLWGLVIFTLGTFIGIISPNVHILILSRTIQGLGSALMVPQSLGIINTHFAPQIRGKSIGFWTGASGLVTLFGPIFAGWLIDNGSWRWVFVSVLPLVMISWVLVIKSIAGIKTYKKFNFDVIGISLLLIGLTLISYGLIRGQSNFSLFNLILILFGIFLLVIFGFYEKKINNPIINFQILSIRAIWISNLFCLLMYIPLTAISILMPVYFQQLVGMSALDSSLNLLPLVIGIIIFSVMSGGAADKFGNKLMILIGTLVCLIGYICLFLIQTEYSLFSFPGLGMFLVGSGFGLFIPAITKVALSVDSSDTGLASGINNSVTRFAGVIAVVAFGGVVTFIFNRNLENVLKSVPSDFNQEIWDNKQAMLEIQIPQSASPEQITYFNQVIDNGFVSGLQNMFLVSIILTLISGGMFGIYYKEEIY